MIISTCHSFISRSHSRDKTIFPERIKENGTMYVEAVDKISLDDIRDIRFVRVSDVLGIIYNSKSGNTRLKWRYIRENLGKVTGDASGNSLVNLIQAGVITKINKS